MPYSKQHKEQTKQKILQNAFQLFSTKGFDGVTINQLMENCKLTRGAFYAHFTSKAALYTESLKYAASNSALTQLNVNNISDKIWLSQLLDGYLSIEHVNGSRPCPLAFLATDIVTRDAESKIAYASAYAGMNESIMAYAKSYTNCDTDDILALTAMIIGAVAISRTIEDKAAVSKLLASCRQQAGIKLGGI
jgi:AcrR family transcriptional regulator